jgi:sugar (pentulose or hexulose) kinase
VSRDRVLVIDEGTTGTRALIIDTGRKTCQQGYYLAGAGCG